MKTLPLALCLAALAHGIALANESQHAAIVDMPKVITLTHASPDTWYTLPPVQPDEQKPTAAYNLRESWVVPLSFVPPTEGPIISGQWAA
jgi:hypothetical protein